MIRYTLNLLLRTFYTIESERKRPHIKYVDHIAMIKIKKFPFTDIYGEIKLSFLSTFIATNKIYKKLNFGNLQMVVLLWQYTYYKVELGFLNWQISNKMLLIFNRIHIMSKSISYA